ncbi:TIR domain-containing protein [Clostridium beijerinckii]|uniref:TIR domain-containing protein n=2 Tax=Clostridium beijerinckii TaxID=1520 RepID=A0AB74VMV3_CLOBE|nr:TIR domain-containing protein [Clostridium beijerinckii]QUN37434.1 TIR domain-containing protein [Clostridium beijerinckii]
MKKKVIMILHELNKVIRSIIDDEDIYMQSRLTLDDTREATEFYDYVVKIAKEYSDISEISNEGRLSEVICNVKEAILLIYFNNSTQIYMPKMEKLFRLAKENQSKIWPIALTKDSRIPPKIIESYQSFDVVSRLENRLLSKDNIKTVAQIFVRQVISECKPTFYTENKLLFVSHKRLDGEDIAAKLCDKINLLGKSKKTFRDVVEVRVGEPAQDTIDSALLQSDVLIFLHTPKSVRAKWIEKEIKSALIYDIPILWIRIDNADTKGLEVIPGDKAHLEYDSKDFDDGIKLEKIVDEVENLCFEIIMNRSRLIYDYVNDFEYWAQENNVSFVNVDKEYQIYKITYNSNKNGLYPRRDYIQYIQYYGRTVKESDKEYFNNFLSKEYQKCGDEKYDSAVLLSSRLNLNEIGNTIFENGFENHSFMWKREVNNKVVKKSKKIVISGAFPESDEELFKQPLMEAVKIFSQEIIKNGYTLIFGAHPTFQKIIFTVAEEFCDDPQQSVSMYISKWFKDSYNISEINKYATVNEIDAETEQNESLTKMREEMLSENNICALICIGGKIKKDSPDEQGVDEEIKLARKSNIDTFLVGSVGGRSSEKSHELKKTDKWTEINYASAALNEEFLYNMDYRSLSKKLFKYIESKER